MKIGPGQHYKLVETDSFIAIIPPDMNVKDMSAQPLVLVDKDKLADYLMAYLTNRELGKPLKEAHNNAMEYVGITVIKH